MKKFLKSMLLVLCLGVLSMNFAACNSTDIEAEASAVISADPNPEDPAAEDPEPEESAIEDPELTGDEIESSESVIEATGNSFDRLQAYVDERGEGIAGGFEARSMTNSATVSVASDDAVLISITLEDEFVQTLAVTLGFFTAVLEEEIESVMPIFSDEAENVEADLGIDGFHFIIEFLLSTGDVVAWQSIYANEVMGEFMTDFSFLYVEEPEATTVVDGERTTIEFDGVTVSLGTPFVMTGDEFREEFPEWIWDISRHYRWLLIYAEITNNTERVVDFRNRPFTITDDFGDSVWQSTAYARLNGTGFDINETIAPGDTLSGYVPFNVSQLASSFEIDVRPHFADDILRSPFAERFIFNFDVEMN